MGAQVTGVDLADKAIEQAKALAQQSGQLDGVQVVGVVDRRQVFAVVNFPPRQIGKFMSEVLTVGFADADGEVVLFEPDHDVPLGSRLF